MAQSTTAEHYAQVDAADRRVGTDADHLGMDLDFCARYLVLCICIRKGTRLGLVSHDTNLADAGARGVGAHES